METNFFGPRISKFRLSDPGCINALLDLMEALTSVSRKRVRLMDVLGFKDAGKALQGFHHIGTRSKNLNMSATDPAMGRWASMLCSHFLACLKDVFKNCLVVVMICTGGCHRSVMCAEVVDRFIPMQGIDVRTVHLCQLSWGKLRSTCEHCVWSRPATCDMSKERNTNLKNIVELIQNNS